jgi:hypothetical protein
MIKEKGHNILLIQLNESHSDCMYRICFKAFLIRRKKKQKLSMFILLSGTLLPVMFVLSSSSPFDLRTSISNQSEEERTKQIRTAAG